MKIVIKSTREDDIDSARLENSTKTALVAIADYVVRKARDNAPRKSGKLADSIHAEVPVSEGENVTSVVVTADVPYAMAIEYGSGVHVPGGEKYPIVPVRAQVLAFRWPNHPPNLSPSKDGKFYFKRVMHPGVAAQPYLKPALERVRKSARAYIAGAVFDALATED